MASDRRFADVRRQLEAHGWTLVRVHSSHHIFAKDGRGLLSIPVKHNKVKPCYVSKVDKACKDD